MNGHERIFIGLGANLPGPDGPPRAKLEAALVALERAGLRIVRRSHWYESAPVPMSDQPWYVNGVVEVEADLDPASMLALLHEIEAAYVRTRNNWSAAGAEDRCGHAGGPSGGGAGAPGILGGRGIKASFYTALGPDNSGRAIFRVFRQQGFWEEMLRTRAPAMYGLRTMLYGTLLPAPQLGPAAAAVLPLIAAAGHETGLHGFDHVRWHDSLLRMEITEVAREIGQAQEVYTRALGRPARAFAAPGWQAGSKSRAALARAGVRYASDTRGYAP